MYVVQVPLSSKIELKHYIGTTLKHLNSFRTTLLTTYLYIWAYGKILEEITSKVEDCAFTRHLSVIASHLIEDDSTRWTLFQAIDRLRMHETDIDFLT